MNKLVLFMACAAFAIISGCNTYKKQLSKATAFFTANSNELAKLCADKFPNKETLKPGKTDTVVTHDTVTLEGQKVPCPPAKDGKPVFVKCPDQKIITKYVDRLRVDTLETKGAEYVVLMNNFEATKDSLLIVKENLKASEKTASTRLAWMWKLGIGLILVAGLAVLKFLGRI